MRGHSYGESDSRHQRCGKLDHVATAVYVVTAGREATYRIERIYIAEDEAQDFADRYNAMQPVEFFHVECWETGAPAAVYDGPVLGGSVDGADASGQAAKRE
jgi:hypothetical protein